MQMILTVTGIRQLSGMEEEVVGVREEREGTITKELKKTFEIKGNVHFLNCGHDFIGVYIYQILPNISYN